MFFLVGVTLESIVIKEVLGEFVNWISTFISSISVESFWNSSSSIIGVHEVSLFINGSWELVHEWMPSWETISLLKNFMTIKLDEVDIISIEVLLVLYFLEEQFLVMMVQLEC